MRRALALWLLLFAAYAATLGLHAFGGSHYGGDEPHYLLAAESIVSDGDLDVRDEYAARAYRDFYPYRLKRQGREAEGRLHEPHGFGFPLLIAPAYAIGGATGVELFVAAIAALGIAVAHWLALRVVPEPWAVGAAAAVGLSPPLLAYSTAVYPEGTAGAILAGAALLAVRIDARPTRREAFLCFALLGALPWLSMKLLPAAAVPAFVAGRGLWRARRRTLGIGSIELALFGLALLVALNEALYGGPTPYSAGSHATGLDSPVEVAERAYRMVALFIDRDLGLLRWAPVLALAFAGGWFLWRSRRERLARVVPAVRDIQLTAGLCAGVLLAQLLVAAFLAPSLADLGFPGRQLLPALPLAIPLVAWGFRRAPRVGAVLAVLTLAGSVWLYVDARTGGALVADPPEAPFGPLTRVLPRFEAGSDWPNWVAAAIGLALAALVLREVMRVRRTVGAGL